MDRTFSVVGSCFRAREFDRVNAAEILDLIARSFQPDVFDARNFSSHVLDPIDGLFAVVIRNIVSEFVHHHVQHRFWLAEAVLYRCAARMQGASLDSRSEYHCAQRNLRGAFHG